MKKTSDSNRSIFHSYKLVFILIFLAGSWLRSIDAWKPVNGEIREAWRECDMAAVARNFYTEDMNVFYPRIDWRGDGPGFAEMEFPLMPWLTAVLYKTFGYNELWGRGLVFTISLLTLMVFMKLSRNLLSTKAAIFSSLFFAFSPLIIRVSNTFQPEGLMMFFYIASVLCFLNYLKQDNWKWWALTAITCMMALLSKINAVHIGLLFLILLLKHKKLNFKSVLLGITILVPVLLWYVHAHSFYHDFGNSLGFSNEAHWIGFDLLKQPLVLLKIFKIDLLFVWMPLGIFVGIFMVRKFWNNQLFIPVLWLACVFGYYLAAARTTSDDWAIYYHVVSVPAVALIFSLGLEKLHQLISKKVLFDSLFTGILLSTILIIVFRLTGSFDPTPQIAVFIVLVSASLLSFVYMLASEPYIYSSLYLQANQYKQHLVHGFLLVAVFSTFSFMGFRISRDIHPNHMQGLFRDSLILRKFIPDDALIIASGGNSLDETGHLVAYNAPYLFYWLDKKGFSISQEEQSIEKIREMEQRGAKYFVAEKESVMLKNGFEKELKQTFHLIDETEHLYLFEIQS